MSSRTQLLLPRPRFMVLKWSVVVALLCASCAMWYRHYCDMRARTAEITRHEEVRARQARSSIPPPVSMSLDQIKKLHALQSELEFPWISVFLAVDEATTANIELLEFSPEKRGRKLTLSGEALNHEALIAYLDALREQKILRSVYLVKRADVTRGTTNFIEFIVEAKIR